MGSSSSGSVTGGAGGLSRQAMSAYNNNSGNETTNSSAESNSKTSESSSAKSMPKDVKVDADEMRLALL